VVVVVVCRPSGCLAVVARQEEDPAWMASSMRSRAGLNWFKDLVWDVVQC
jgi:hypothetical protein